MRDGSVMATKQADLVEYGIAQDESDYRLHVCLGTGFAYLYPTPGMTRLIGKRNYPLLSGHQQEISDRTSAGYNVPLGDVPGLREIIIPADLLARVTVMRQSPLNEKGRQAVQMAKALFRRGLVPLPLEAEEYTDLSTQLKGLDLIVRGSSRVQVKCDFLGGRGGPFNALFVQTHERNPRRLTDG